MLELLPKVRNCISSQTLTSVSLLQFSVYVNLTIPSRLGHKIFVRNSTTLLLPSVGYKTLLSLMTTTHYGPTACFFSDYCLQGLLLLHLVESPGKIPRLAAAEGRARATDLRQRPPFRKTTTVRGLEGSGRSLPLSFSAADSYRLPSQRFPLFRLSPRRSPSSSRKNSLLSCCVVEGKGCFFVPTCPPGWSE